jgi:Leucine-rich repeat (LRR) protein
MFCLALKMLSNLIILNIASNNITSLAPLNACHALQSLDASDNSLRQIDDLSQLLSLKVNTSIDSILYDSLLLSVHV